MLPSEIPIFPLPNVVLFPSALLPLHIFEPRYRAMVARRSRGRATDRHGDAAARLGAALRRRPTSIRSGVPGSSPTPTGCPMAGTTSCCAAWRSSGSRTSGRPATAPNATASRASRSIKEATAGASAAIQDARQRLERLIARKLHKNDHDSIPKDIPDADLVNAIAQHLEPLEKQALLECNSLLERCEALVELLEMRMMPTHGGKSRHALQVLRS